MKKIYLIVGASLVLIIAGSIIYFSLYYNPPKYNIPAGAIQVSKLLESPVYTGEVMIYGKVSVLGEVDCPCFYLSSGGKTVSVWYGLEKDVSHVDIAGIENGDMVWVRGHLSEETNIPPRFNPTYIGEIWPSYKSRESPPIKPSTNNQAPTGQRDTHGCWLPSGEYWCATQNKCLENTKKCDVASNVSAKTVIVKLKHEVIIEPGLSIIPERVKEDSRCTDMCTSPGTIILSISTYGTSFPVNRGATIPITLGIPFIIEGYEVTLTKVLPGPNQLRPTLPEEYSFEFLII